MDILIKGIEMPKNGDVLKLYLSDGYVGYQDEEGLHKSNEVELPEHGRLGDLDALKNSVADMRMEKPLRNGAKQVIEIGELFGRIIDDAPTVLEANE